ncbi:MAG: hypothetical protein GX224_03240 [Thermoplasmatales archaeon]|nr:hypothetical protein [Thermoplasmatales archaeon]
MTFPITMDGYLASIMAAESVVGCRAVLHGPGGCRTHTALLSAREALRQYAPREGPFYFGHPRVPCTYVDEEDYINGADYKVTELLDTVDDAEMCVVVSTPGTSLIGDDLHGAATRSTFPGITIILEECHMSKPAHVGYDSTIAKMVSAVCRPMERETDVVNVLGLPILLEGWEDTADELRAYLDALSLEVGAFVGAGCAVDELVSSARADVNVAVLPEFCAATAEAYERMGIPTICPGAPLGFDATSDWILAVAEATGKNPGKALTMVEKIGKRASNVLASGLNAGIMARGATFSVKLENSLALPLSRWLYEYLAMFPVCIESREWWDPDYRRELENFLSSIGCDDALGREICMTRADAAFADGHTARLLEDEGMCSVGVDMGKPSPIRLRFRERPILGAKGAMRMLDDLFNGMASQ